MKGSRRVAASDIDGVSLIKLPVFEDDRGKVFPMLRATDPHFLGFGEIYFSSVYRGVVKAWKRHHRLTASYACAHGLLRMVLFDERTDSRTTGGIAEVLLGPDEYHLLVVPPGIWNGFVGLADPVSIIANAASEPYDPAEFDRIDPFSTDIPYLWETSALAGSATASDG